MNNFININKKCYEKRKYWKNTAKTSLRTELQNENFLDTTAAAIKTENTRH